MGVLCRSVVEARACLDGGSSMGWAFWDVKGGLQNVRTTGVLNRALECEPLRMWMGWLQCFMAPHGFEALWDSKVRGMGRAEKGVPHGSPLSPILFLM